MMFVFCVCVCNFCEDVFVCLLLITINRLDNEETILIRLYMDKASFILLLEHLG